MAYMIEIIFLQYLFFFLNIRAFNLWVYTDSIMPVFFEGDSLGHVFCARLSISKHPSTWSFCDMR